MKEQNDVFKFHLNRDEFNLIHEALHENLIGAECFADEVGEENCTHCITQKALDILT